MYEIIKTVINEWDPVSLLESNPEVYEPQIAVIFKFIEGCNNCAAKKLAGELDKVFSKDYEGVYVSNPDACAKAAQRILEMLIARWNKPKN